MTDDPPPAIPAATLVILRDAGGGAPPEILMVERAQAMAFAAGALVFPGGRVDPGDDDLASAPAGDGGEAAARVAAIRETIEEVGIAIGLSPTPGAAAIARMRAALAGGAPFGDLLAAEGVTLTPDVLTPFARWRPTHRHARIYDTRFYLARLPADAPPPLVDAGENSRAFWASARATLAMVDAGTAGVIFPTHRNLERLARFADIDAAYADAARHPVRTVSPWIEERGGVACLCIPEGLGYPVTAEPLATVRRS